MSVHTTGMAVASLEVEHSSKKCRKLGHLHEAHLWPVGRFVLSCPPICESHAHSLVHPSLYDLDT